MVGKAAFVLGLGVGYVLGARAGRERYEQIVTQADRLWHDPKVQQKAAQARDLAKEKAPVVQEKVTEAARHGVDKVTPGSGGNDSGHDDLGHADRGDRTSQEPTSDLPGMVGSAYAEGDDR